MARIICEDDAGVVVALEPWELRVPGPDWEAVIKELARTSIDLAEKRKQVEYLAGELHQAETDRAALRIEVQELKARLGFGPGQPPIRTGEPAIR